MERGQLRPNIDLVLLLERMAEAQEKLANGYIQGMIVLKVTED